MCFSAPASFAAGAVLISCSVATLHRAWRINAKFLPLAAFPLFFGMQQIAEGFLWLELDGSDSAPHSLSALAFLFFAYWFWPVWVPISVLVAETDLLRRRVFSVFTLLGVSGGAILYLPILENPADLQINLVRRSIRYVNPEMFSDEVTKTIARLIYTMIVCVPLLWSSHVMVRKFGLLILISVLIGFAVASHAFTSIWCFLAAGLSAYMVVVLNELARNPNPIRLHQS
ncbi:DUF6629 family protein [Aliiruegeria lutimaris]|uniref:Uncharacterized protein n=1 Tax=Aliiruegeria lutimaris TaxID=571298 RepID=A0A1G9NI02_9RHOB|nr:DUF6629 family protein [Aliiruegeria lutimaris]SDL85953.1 hypothetical protein SAMN04488026_11235 [Aliiruegeria lutimaris]